MSVTTRTSEDSSPGQLWAKTKTTTSTKLAWRRSWLASLTLTRIPLNNRVMIMKTAKMKSLTGRKEIRKRKRPEKTKKRQIRQ